MNVYLRALRAPFLVGSVVPVWIGVAYALHTGRFALQVFWAGFSPVLLAAFAALPLGVGAVRILWREYLSHEGVVPPQAMTIQALVFQGLLITLGLSMSRWLPWWGS